MRSLILPGVGVAMAALLAGCPPPKEERKRLTVAEARQAVEEMALASQAENLTSASVEISTSFTIGQAVQDAAAELRTFIETQLPCADVSLQGATLNIDYGAKAGSCVYKGHTFSGSHTIEVQMNEDAKVAVRHEWTDFSNGRVTLDGSADVTWDLQAKTRRVEHTANWTRVSDGYQVTGEGDRVQSLLPGGLAEGIQIDGSRSWTTGKGTWDLAIDGVQLRWVDAVPQAGSYSLSTPAGKSLGLGFERVNETTINVTVSGSGSSFSFNVTQLGAVSQTGS